MPQVFHSLKGYNNPNALQMEMYWCDMAKGFSPTAYYTLQDIPEIPIMYQGTFDPSDTGWLDADGASEAHYWGISLSERLDDGTAYSGYICLDWEAKLFNSLLWGAYPGGCATNPSVGACAQQAAIALLDVMKDLYPFAKIGYYAIPIGDYWRAFASDGVVSSSPPNQTTFAEWQNQNDYMKTITDHQGVLFPSVYNNYVLTGEHPTAYADWPIAGASFWPCHPGGITGAVTGVGVGWTSGATYVADAQSPTAQTINPIGIQRDPFNSHRHWERYQQRVNEALRISDGKPVIAFVWDRIHTNADPYGGMINPESYDKAMVQYAVREAKYETVSSGGTITYRPTGYVLWGADNFWSWVW